MVLCHPGTLAMAKSHPTIEWTETATGMMRIAKMVEATWYRRHSLWVPRNPRARTV